MTKRTDADAAHRRVPAVTRAIAILRRLGASAEPLGVNQIARDLGLVPSTCLHILRVLVAEGLVEFDPAAKRYVIGAGILPIARSAIQRNTFATLAQPILVQLSERLEATTLATQLLTVQQMVVVALSHAKLPFRLSAELGSRFPDLISATGRCVAAFNGLDARTLRQRFRELKWENPPAFETWLDQVAQARRDGFGVDRGDYIGGVTIVAVPLFDAHGIMTRGLVAVGISEKMEAVGVPHIARELLAKRDELSALMVGE